MPILRKKEDLNLTNLNELEKEEETKPKVGKRKEVIKIRTEISEIENRKTIEKINKVKSWLF